MTRRAWIERLAPATLAAFVATVAAPRPGILVHHHAGGAFVHVHPDEGAGAPDHDDAADHPLGPGETALAAPEQAEGWHAHARHPFQLAGRPAAARPARVESVAALRPTPHIAPLAAPRCDTRARAPPPLAAL